MDKLFVIKIGGNIIDDELKLSSFLKSFAALKANKILVHGGGKLASRLAEKLAIKQQLVDGRRITDAATLNVVTMVYAGSVNKTIVAQLQANNCNALGLSGADGNIIKAHKRTNAAIDYGFVGDVDLINVSLLQTFLVNSITPILAPITHDSNGQLLNTNADTIAQEVAKALSKLYQVQLIYSFEKSGVLTDVNDESSVISIINQLNYQNLKSTQKIFAGMIPKLDNAFSALNNGVQKVIIGKAEHLQELIEGKSGTTIIHE
ncbi:MAG: acetylglutamate kinase [Bacteroidetes bacterium]|nr:acetylglutamate kinase [Bacteroidota bacterium]